MSDLDQKIKEYYSEQRLSGDELTSIKQRARFKPKRNLAIAKYTVAASIVLLFSSILFLQPELKKNKVVTAYAMEVVKNHMKQSPVEVMSSSSETLNQSLSKLNFDITYGERLKAYGTLVGGRYCHIDDQIAAQLKIVDDSENSYTCYQFKQQHSIKFDKSRQIEGALVDLWTEGDIVFAIAKTE